MWATDYDHGCICVNGIDATTGDYLLPILSVDDVAFLASGHPPNVVKYPLTGLRPLGALGLAYGVDPTKLSQAGWAVIFAAGMDNAVRDALTPLRLLRERQSKSLYRELEFRQGETAASFLRRNGAGPSDIDPKKVPLYLLLVGSPELLPYEDQYELGADYAVGRLYFDQPDSYASYAESVVNAEMKSLGESERCAVFFGTQNPGDAATRRSARRLVHPLRLKFEQAQANWSIVEYLAADATKTNLARVLNEAPVPSLLFTATHGLGFPNGHAQQLQEQGALVCQEWRTLRGAVEPGAYFSASDIDGQRRLDGLIAFCFACFSAGTPLTDEYSSHVNGAPKELARHPFVAALPQRMLELGALAVIGHVERAWAYSFQQPGLDTYIDAFSSCVRSLADGLPVGFAMSWFRDRFKTNGLRVLRQSSQKDHDPVEFAMTWLCYRDARNYAILGDPAVRLSTAVQA